MTTKAVLPRPLGGHLNLPAAVDRTRLVWPYTVTVAVYHLVALLAVLPWFFSWTGLILATIGVFVFGSLGINLGYHRLLTHRGFACPKWLEHTFAVLGVCSMQDTPARWVAVHRRHHQFSDQQDDPHSPLVHGLWGHVGWMLIENRDLARLGIYDRYAKDILRDPFYRRMEKSFLYPTIVLASWAIFFATGLAIALLSGADLQGALQLGTSVLLWAVFVRTVAVWHITWLVNSACGATAPTKPATTAATTGSSPCSPTAKAGTTTTTSTPARPPTATNGGKSTWSSGSSACSKPPASPRTSSAPTPTCPPCPSRNR